MLNLELTGKNLLVIGGSRGIGAAIVRLAAEAGAQICWTCSNSDRGINASERLLAELSGKNCFYMVSDCRDAVKMKEVCEAVIEKFGSVDCVVYNAGITDPKKMLDITPEEWTEYVDINLNGAFISIREPLRYMSSAGGGSIVLIGSAAVATGGGGRADYISAKAGLETLSKAITKEFAGKGVRCNVVHPSLILTDLLAERYPDEDMRKQAAATVPAGRLGTPDDIAYAAIFFLSDIAGYITGQALYVDGGRTFCS